VRNGFVPQLRREVATRFKGLEIDTCPFANLPERKRTQRALTKEEMENCVWLKPELVAQIEFTEWTPDGHLRHSKFIGLIDDKDAREVVREFEGLAMAPKHYRGLASVSNEWQHRPLLLRQAIITHS
jgi:ATP-dependent DNA ligase